MTLELLVVDRLATIYHEPILDENLVQVGSTIERFIPYHIIALKQKFSRATFFNDHQEASSFVRQGNPVDVAVINPLLYWELNKGRELMKNLKDKGIGVIFIYNGIEPRELKLTKGVHYDQKHGPIYMPEELIEQILWLKHRS